MTNIRKVLVTILLTAVAATSLASCARPSADSEDGASSAATQTPSPDASSPESVVAQPPVEVPGGKAQWLSVLPPPATVDRRDVDAVIRAYVITALTWDTQVDRTDAYATVRSTIWMTEANRDGVLVQDPDAARDQGVFLSAAQHQARSSVTILDVFTDEDPEVLAADGAHRRIVSYEQSIVARDGSAEIRTTGSVWVTMLQDSTGWSVDQAFGETDK